MICACKLLTPTAKKPTYATIGASGADLYADEGVIIRPGCFVKVKTGISLMLSPGYEGQIRSRSGLAAKHGIVVLNAPATIDSDHTGEIIVLLANHGEETYSVVTGDRIAQLIVAVTWRADFEDWLERVTTTRGTKGFGSTGR